MMIFKNFTYAKFTSGQLTELCKDQRANKYSSVLSYVNRLTKLGYIEISKEGNKKMYNIKEVAELTNTLRPLDPYYKEVVKNIEKKDEVKI
jgi:Cdc6-like AAA superfamily ATPase